MFVRQVVLATASFLDLIMSDVTSRTACTYNHPAVKTSLDDDGDD